jgi:crotonobetainyl-CoA:carnitine CoA-transferase CaiB-like acyl-CoA transferase
MVGGKPLRGIKIVEFTHAVMGPACGMILADLGAEVAYVEPPEGSPTRRLKGFGSGYFPYFGRSKKSLTLNLKKPEGHQLAVYLLQKADVLVENFAPGTMERLGLGYRDLKVSCPKLIYCSLKGFLSGPYEDRVALDEVVQMMGGLAYMTGPRGNPLRAGTSVVDITGGMFGVIGILAALRKRDETGQGCHLASSLFETTAFLMGQHLACSTVSGQEVAPMPERVSAWSIYQVFSTRTDPIFIGVISDKHWKSFCKAFDFTDFAQDVRFMTNNLRIDHREILLPKIKEKLCQMTFEEVSARALAARIPFAPISKPEDLFDDPQLNEGGFEWVEFPDGKRGKQPRLPLEFGGERVGVEAPSPALGAHQKQIFQNWLGIDSKTFDQWEKKGAFL